MADSLCTRTSAQSTTHTPAACTRCPASDKLSPKPEQVQPDEDAPLDMRTLYREQATCGYDRDLKLHAYEAERVMARLRGINAVTATLIACESNEVRLGDWMRSGLLEAIHALTADAERFIELANDRAEPGAREVNHGV